jgi:hypothetical protein
MSEFTVQSSLGQLQRCGRVGLRPLGQGRYALARKGFRMVAID